MAIVIYDTAKNAVRGGGYYFKANCMLTKNQLQGDCQSKCKKIKS